MILFYAAAAFLSGVVLAALGGASARPLVALGGAGLAFGTLLAGRRGWAAALALLVLLGLVGIDGYEESLPPSQSGGVALLNDSSQPVSLRGVVVDGPEEGDRTQRFTLRVKAVDSGEGFQDAEGRVLVTARQFPAFRYGDVIEMTAKLETPPIFDTFNYREYLARRGITSQTLFPTNVEVVGREGSALTRLLIDARSPLGEALERALPEPESALARGILLGQRAAIPDDLTDDLNRAGISHLVAISGQNVAIVAGVLVASLAWLIGRRPATAAAILLIWLYALFVGGSPSVLRSTVMATVMLGATLAGRPGSSLGAVTLAAALLVAWRPLVVEDVAFQLSFAATLGIVLTARPLQERLQGGMSGLPDGPSTFLAENLAITIAASVAVLPVIAGSFGRLSLVSLPANLLAAPAFVLALGGSLVAALAGLIDANIGLVAGELAYLPLAYLIWLGEFFADMPLSSVELSDVGVLESLALTLPLLLLWMLVRKPASADLEPVQVARMRPALVGAAVLILLAGFVWYSALQPDSGRLRVTVLDVGQGDAILIESPVGHRILVDGGPSGARIAQALGRVLPPSERRIDLMILTHAQDDHLTGLIEVLRRFDVGAALAGPLEGETAAYQAWREAISDAGVSLVTPRAGEWIDLGDGARLEVLSPPQEPLTGTEDDFNNNSVVLRLVYGEASFLLTGDLEADGEDALLDGSSDLHATVLKVGHHGSDGSTTPAFLNAVDPSFAVISSGVENTFGHPSPTTRLRLAGVPLLRTDENGDVRFETDGASLWVDFQRGDYELVSFGLTR